MSGVMLLLLSLMSTQLTTNTTKQIGKLGFDLGQSYPQDTILYNASKQTVVWSSPWLNARSKIRFTEDLNINPG